MIKKKGSEATNQAAVASSPFMSGGSPAASTFCAASLCRCARQRTTTIHRGPVQTWCFPRPSRFVGTLLSSCNFHPVIRGYYKWIHLTLKTFKISKECQSHCIAISQPDGSRLSYSCEPSPKQEQEQSGCHMLSWCKDTSPC